MIVDSGDACDPKPPVGDPLPPWRCPQCDSADVHVTDSRKQPDHHRTLRRKHCRVCEYRFSTAEIVVRDD